MDENDIPQQPGQNPPPPAPPAYPPQQPAAAPPPAQPQYQQPQAAQPVYGAPQPGQAPGAKKKTALILIIIVVIALLCALMACGIGAFALIGSGASDQELLDEADIHYDTASSMVEDIDTHYDVFFEIEGDSTSAEREEQYATSAVDIANADAELTSAHDLVLSMGESETKSLFLESIALMQQSLNTYDTLYSGLPEKLDLIEELDDLWYELEEADAQLSDATISMNAEDYSSAQGDADAAGTAYTEAIARLGILDKEYPGLGIDEQIEIEHLYLAAATALSNAASAGAAGDDSGLRTYTGEYTSADEAVGNASWPEWTDDYDLLLVTEIALYDDAWEYAEASWEKYDLSVEAWDSGD